MILVLSGTRDGRDIVKKLLDRGQGVVVTVTTKYGQELLGNEENMKVYCDKLDKSSFKKLIYTENIKAIIDATHPYATEISKLAMVVSGEMNIAYKRYERKSEYHKGVLRVKNHKEAANLLKDVKGNIMLTTGSKNIEGYSRIIEKNRLYVRVLPTSNVLSKCEDLGISANHILGLQGPFSVELNKALFKEYDIAYMVTKESGSTGGTSEKIQSALDLGIKVILIDRPNIKYINVYEDIQKLIDSLI